MVYLSTPRSYRGYLIEFHPKLLVRKYKNHPISEFNPVRPCSELKLTPLGDVGFVRDFFDYRLPTTDCRVVSISLYKNYFLLRPTNKNCRRWFSRSTIIVEGTLQEYFSSYKSIPFQKTRTLDHGTNVPIRSDERKRIYVEYHKEVHFFFPSPKDHFKTNKITSTRISV